MDRNKGSFIPPDGGYGWVIILATTLINVSLLPLVQCFGIIFQKEFKSMGITAAETSFLLHLHTAVWCSLSLLASPLLKKYSFRIVALLGTLLMCTGIFSSSFAKSYGVFIFTVSILIGVGQGILLPATYLATNTYFKKRLTLAISFSVTGASISSIFMPQLCQKLLSNFGRTTTVLVLSAISTVAIFCCFLLKPVKRVMGEILNDPPELPDRIENKEEFEMLNTNGNVVYKETTLPVKRKSVLSKLHDLFNLELLKEKTYVVAIIGMSISFASELNIVLMIPFVLPELAEFTPADVATAMSVQSVADITGRLIVPYLGHFLTISPKVMYASSLITSTVGRTVMAIFYSSRPTIFSCAALLGLAKGTKAVYQSVIIPRYVSLDKLPAANGLNMLLTGALSLIIGPIIGLIHDKTNSYVYALHAGSLLSMSCVGLWTIHYFLAEKTKTRQENAEIT